MARSLPRRVGMGSTTYGSGGHLVRRPLLVARSRPRLPFPKLQLAGSLLEIGPTDLVMDRAEALRLIAATGLSTLPPGTAEAIHAAAGGWIAGILLCALHVRSSPEPDRASATLGDNLQLHEYLNQEVLEGLPAGSRRTLLDLSILRSPSPALCEAVLERTDTDAPLADLADRLPLLERREDGNWHLHPLVGSGLASFLRSRDPKRYRALHRRAARWNLVHGQAEAAVRHALEARDADLLESVAERALQNLFRNSEFFAMQRHVRDLPPALAHDRPFLSLFLAWALFHMGREKEGETHLDRARRLAREGTPGDRRDALLAHEAFLRSILLRLEGNTEASLEIAASAFQECRDRKPFLATSLRVQMAVGRFLSGDLDGAARALDEAEAVARRTRMHWAIDCDDLEAKRMRLLLPRLPGSVQHAWLARTLPLVEHPALLQWDVFRTAVHLLTCLGRAEEALVLCKAWHPFLEEDELTLPLLETEYATALASQFLGRRSDAVAHLDASLRRAARMGVVGPYVHGPELDGIRREVLIDWRRSGKGDAATIALAARLSDAGPAASIGARAVSVLSERETEVLRAIREGRSNKEIAEALFVAESTVKTHLKNIFAKLKVTNRTRAVSLATEAGMI